MEDILLWGKTSKVFPFISTAYTTLEVLGSIFLGCFFEEFNIT